MEQYALSLVEALLELGHKPVVFTMDADTSLPFYSDCKVHQCLTAWLPNKLKVVKFGRWFEHISRDMKLDTSIACSLTPGAEIDCCGGTHIGYLKAMKRSPWFYDRWTIATERRLYSRAKLIVAHADIMKQELRDFYGINPDKITTLYPPLTINTQDTDQTRSELPDTSICRMTKPSSCFLPQAISARGFPFLKTILRRETERNYSLLPDARLKESAKTLSMWGTAMKCRYFIKPATTRFLQAAMNPSAW